jgi:ketosteroid isomerase-like protein
MTQDSRASVLEAESRRCAAMLAGDVAALDRLLDPRLHFSHANGSVDNKAEYLAKIAAGRIGYISIAWSEQKLMELGDTALLAGRMSTVVTVDGNQKRLENQVLSVWTQQQGWRLVAFQSTPLAK